MFADVLATEATAPSLDQAVEKALALFDCSRAEVETEILEVPFSGIFGLFGKKEARVVVRITDRAVIARRIAQKLLQLAGFEARVEVVSERKRIELEIISEESSLIIGRHGQNLDSLQSLVVTLTDRVVSDRAAIVLNIDNYRQRRIESLTKLAHRISAQVRHSGRPATLHPLPPEERRILHRALQKNVDIETRSIGCGYERKMIISSRKG